jgi:hypothetical protein
MTLQNFENTGIYNKFSKLKNKVLQEDKTKQSSSNSFQSYILPEISFGKSGPVIDMIGVKPKPKSDTKTYNDTTTQPYAYAPTPNVDIDAADFNFQTNETVMSASVQQMNIPKTGKDRVIEQRAKEKKWKQDSEQVEKPKSYQEAMAQRKTGKRGRKKTISDYVKGVDKEAIVDSLILTETKDNEDNLND